MRQQVGPVGVGLDEGPQHFDDQLRLSLTGRSQIDVLVVERSEAGERIGQAARHADHPVARRGVDDRRDERGELLAP